MFKLFPEEKNNLVAPHGNLSSFSLGTWLFPRKKDNFPRERPKFVGETYIPKTFAIRTIPCLLLYKLVTYHWKGLEESYNFVVGSILIKFYMKFF
jgi:hypothetical protein